MMTIVRKVLETEVQETYYHALNMKDDVEFFIEGIQKLKDRFFEKDSEQEYDLDYMVDKLSEFREKLFFMAFQLQELKETVAIPSSKWKPWVEVEEDEDDMV
jgi:hypothetical protein